MSEQDLQAEHLAAARTQSFLIGLIGNIPAARADRAFCLDNFNLADVIRFQLVD